MIIFQNPGGNPGDDDVFIGKMDPIMKAEYHRRNFPAWLGTYYTYNYHIFRYLERDGYISKHLTYFQNAMEEIYFTDAIKCRITGKDSLKERYRTCSDNYLRKEIDQLPNLRIIIACGQDALNSLKAMCDNPAKAIGVISKTPIKSFKYKNLQNFSHGDIYDFRYKERKDWMKIIHFAHPSYIYNRNKIDPVIRENVFLKEACKFVFNSIKELEKEN